MSLSRPLLAMINILECAIQLCNTETTTIRQKAILYIAVSVINKLWQMDSQTMEKLTGR